MLTQDQKNKIYLIKKALDRGEAVNKKLIYFLIEIISDAEFKNKDIVKKLDQQIISNKLMRLKLSAICENIILQVKKVCE